jgi:hypothetical protein
MMSVQGRDLQAQAASPQPAEEVAAKAARPSARPEGEVEGEGTWLRPAEVLWEFARAALPAYELDPLTELTLLNVSENGTFRIDEPDGGRSVLRVHRSGYHTKEAIASELDWISALRERRSRDHARLPAGTQWRGDHHQPPARRAGALRRPVRLGRWRGAHHRSDSPRTSSNWARSPPGSMGMPKHWVRPSTFTRFTSKLDPHWARMATGAGGRTAWAWARRRCRSWVDAPSGSGTTAALGQGRGPLRPGPCRHAPG